MINLPDPAHVKKAFRDPRTVPFPHAVFHGLGFPREYVEWAASRVPPADDERWDRHRNKLDPASPPKLGMPRVAELLGPPFDLLCFVLTSKMFCQWLSAATGIRKLVSDKTFAGAGLHGVLPGGSLGIHCDFCRHGNLYRRVNCFLYLNPGWEFDADPGAWNGDLELVGETVTRSISPQLGTFVIFESSDRSWHGHPRPLACPQGRMRASLASYYYSRERPEWYSGDHSTLYEELGDASRISNDQKSS